MIKFVNISNYESEKSNDGRECEILAVIANPNDQSILDSEAMPQFQIRFKDNGELATAFPDEIERQYWTNEMKSCLNGLHGGEKKECDNLEYYEYGNKLRIMSM